MLADITDGIIIDKTDDITYKNLYQHVYNKKVVQQSFSAILITGYQPVILDGKLSKYNGIDTDEDSLTDWVEVGIEHWKKQGLIEEDGRGNIILPTIEKCLDKKFGLSYVQEGLERFQSNLGVNFGTAIAGVRVLPILSDPTRKDSDGDGIDDVDDDEKLIPSLFPVKEICFTPCSNGQHSSTICVTKLYNGNAIWEKWEDDNTDPDQIVSYLLTDELKDKLIKYANEKVAFGTDNYPIILGYTTEAVEARRLRDFKAAVYSTQSILDDTLNQYPYIKKYSDEYYGLWLYFVDLRITYDEAGHLITEAVNQSIYILSTIIPLAKNLVSNIRQYANIRHTVKLVGGKQNFIEIQKIISNYGNEAVEVLQKYDSITNIAQIENEIVENAVDKMGVSSKIEQSAELANLELSEQKYTEPPYKPGTKTQIVTFSDDIVLVRTLNENSNPSGVWWMRVSDIAGLSPLEIRKKFALPKEPIDYVIAKIPAGSTFRVGIANSLYGCKGGGLQFEIYGMSINPDWIIENGHLQ